MDLNNGGFKLHNVDVAQPFWIFNAVKSLSGVHKFAVLWSPTGRQWPAPIVILASCCDVALMACLASYGIFVAQLPIWIIGMLVATTLIFTLAMDTIKLSVFASVRID
jgi:hypothetical protein